MWQRVDEKNIQGFLDSLASDRELVYKDFNNTENVERFTKFLDRETYEMWWYSGDRFALHLGIKVLRDGRGKSWLYVPTGAVVGEDSSRILFDKISERFLELHVEKFIGRSNQWSKYNATGAMRQMLPHLKVIDDDLWQNVSENSERSFIWQKK